MKRRVPQECPDSGPGIALPICPDKIQFHVINPLYCTVIFDQVVTAMDCVFNLLSKLWDRYRKCRSSRAKGKQGKMNLCQCCTRSVRALFF